jgi:hypothetical protein
MTQDAPISPHDAGHEFFETLGRCISAWANVDDELFRIFRDCIGPYEQSAIIFYRTPGLDVRLALTEEIVLSVLPKTEKRSGAHPHVSVKAWNKLAAHFRELLSTRRRLAHHPVSVRYDRYFQFGVTPFGTAPFYSGQQLDPHIEIHVGDHERLRDKAAELPALTIADLSSHLSSVRQLANGLNNFSRDVLFPLLEESLRTKHEQSP